MSFPSNVTVPLLAGISRRMIFPRVVLPLPLSPMSVTTSPRSMPKLTLRSAGVMSPPALARKNLETWSICRALMLGLPLGLPLATPR
jgi:hypothetical protein